MSNVVVVTGASAGVGRAAVLAFARHGCDVALVARNAERLEHAAAEARSCGVRAVTVTADVADYQALNHAADRIEQLLGPIDVWVNNAMATVFAPVSETSPDEFRRATEVTYLGQVHGTMVALQRMRARNAGTIVNVGSALAYRAIPLQAAYCGAKFAVRGFTDALRTELLHDRSNVHLTMVHLAAMNTPQFDWARDKMDRRPQPVPPVFQPEVAADAIVFAAFHRRREVWVGWPTVKAILGNKLFPGLLDRYLAKFGYSGQLTAEPSEPDCKGNLFDSVPGHDGSHGRFDHQARDISWQMVANRNRGALMGCALALCGLAIAMTVPKAVRRDPYRRGAG